MSLTLGACTNDAFGALEDTRSFRSPEKIVVISSLESGAHRFQGGKQMSQDSYKEEQ